MTGRERGRKGERKSEMRIEAGRDPWAQSYNTFRRLFRHLAQSS